MKICTMENVTLFMKDRKYIIEVSENEFENNEKDQESLRKESPYYFALDSIEKENNKYILNFDVDEGFKPIIDSKKYSTVLRLSLLDRLLKIDPINNFKEKTLIHPQNIFFNETSTLKFLYRNNSNAGVINRIDEYKLLIFSILSNYSYEQYKIKKSKLLKKEKNEFFLTIDNAATVKELHELINAKLYKEETQHFFEMEKQNKNNDKVKFRLIASIIFLAFIGVFASLITNKVTSHKIQAVYTNKLFKADKQIEAYEDLTKGDFNIGLKLLKETDASKEQLAIAYYMAGEFDNAIAIDSSYAKKTVDKFYSENQPAKILELDPKDKYIKNEQSIIQYDYSALLLLKVTLEDKEQLKRLALSFIEHQAFNDALDINDKIKDSDIEIALSNKERELSKK